MSDFCRQYRRPQAQARSELHFLDGLPRLLGEAPPSMKQVNRGSKEERPPPEKVLNSANIERRNRRGFIQPPNSIGFHGASGD
jgi:hypothetical protein